MSPTSVDSMPSDIVQQMHEFLLEGGSVDSRRTHYLLATLISILYNGLASFGDKDTRPKPLEWYDVADWLETPHEKDIREIEDRQKRLHATLTGSG